MSPEDWRRLAELVDEATHTRVVDGYAMWYVDGKDLVRIIQAEAERQEREPERHSLAEHMSQEDLAKIVERVMLLGTALPGPGER